MYEGALSTFREVSDRNNSAMTLINMAGIMKDDGDLAGAKKTYDEALGLCREVNNQAGVTSSLTAIGTVLDAKGDSTAAVTMLEEAPGIDLDGRPNKPSSDLLIDLGDALQHLGELPESRRNYESALTLARTGGDKSMAAYALAGLGSLELKAANFSQSHKDYDEALALRNELGEKDTAASTRLAMAELAIEEGHPDAAEGPAREARDWFEKAHKNDDQVAATALLATALLADGKRDDAYKELNKTAPIAAKSQNLSVQLAFAITKARARTASHDVGAARTILREALAKATKSNYVGYQFECRLALEEIELKSGKPAASRGRLEQLQKEAKNKGFDLIVGKSAAP